MKSSHILPLILVVCGWTLAYWFAPAKLVSTVEVLAAIGAGSLAIGATTLAALTWD